MDTFGLIAIILVPLIIIWKIIKAATRNIFDIKPDDRSRK